MPAFDFRRFLLELVDGRASAATWSKHAVTHYAEARTESARRRLVRISLEAGPWDWHDVPAAVRQCARDLLRELNEPYAARP